MARPRLPVAAVATRGMSRVLKVALSHDRPSPTHPTASAIRNNGLAKIVAMAKHLKTNPYFVLMTRRLLEEVDGQRVFRGAPTLVQPSLDLVNDPYAFGLPADALGFNDLIVLVDRDYYVDMNEIFLLGHPVAIFTFDPIYPCFRSNEYEYSFDATGQVIGSVMGGRDWRHYLWDYPDDMLHVSRRSVLSVFKVLRYRVSDDRSVILFYPVGSSFCITPTELKRRNPVHGNALVSVHRNTTYVSTIGAHEYVSLRSAVWEALVGSVRSRSTINSISTVTMADIERILDAHESADDKVTTAFLWNVLKSLDFTDLKVTLSTSPSDFNISRSTIPERVTGFAHLDSNGDGEPEDNTTGMTPLGSPLIEAGAVPERSVQNTVTAIEQRCILPQEKADKATETIDDRFYNYVEEFVDQLTCGVTLKPVDDEEVARRMSRPNQRAEQAEASTQPLGASSSVRQFQKSEAYTNVNDPRNITTEKGIRKQEFCKYTYPVAEMLKTKEWYAFGRSCPEVAARVTSLCTWALLMGIPITLTDFNRFDGTVSAFARYFIARVYQRLYPNDDFLEGMLEQCHGRWVLTSEAVKYFSGYSQLSGDNNTSIMGTLFNAFTQFCAFRDLGKSAEEAMKALGVYGGDDGFTPIDDPLLLQRVCAELGLSLDLNVVYPPNHPLFGTGEKYVQFLARIYGPGVWYDDQSSCCDFVRTVSKFMQTDSAVPSKPIRLWEKAYAAHLNDRNTPIFGRLCSTIVEIADHIMKRKPFEAASLEEFFMKYGRNVNYWGAAAVVSAGYPNGNQGNWIHAYVEACCPELDVHAAQDQMDRVCSDALEAALKMEPKGKSKKELKLLLAEAFAPLCNLPPLFTRPLTAKAGADVLIISTDDTIRIKHDGLPRTPEITDKYVPDVRPNMVEAYQITGAIKRGETSLPFSDFQIGARKCMYVATHFVESIKKRYPPSKLGGCQIVYTGAYSPMTAVPIAKYLVSEFSRAYRIHFIDPALQPNKGDLERQRVISELKAIPKINVRGIAYTDALMEEILDGAERDGRRSLVFWLDDAFSNSSPDANSKYMTLKQATLNRFMSKLSFSSVKFREDCQIELAVPRENCLLYHTPRRSEYFSEVGEHRLEVSGTTGIHDYIRIAHSDACVTIDQAVALYALVLVDQTVKAWIPPPPREGARDPKGKDQKWSRRKDKAVVVGKRRNPPEA